MKSVVVLYGEPTNREEFDAHYVSTHVPLASKLPGLKEYTYGRCADASGAQAPYYYLARLVFDTAQKRAEALGSPEMAAAGADVATFASGGATILLVDDEFAGL